MIRSIRSKRIIFTLVVLFLLSCAGYFAYRAFFTPEAVKRRAVERWINIVGASVELPKGEIPTLGTVTNLEKLREQPFFGKAERGDKVLIYPRANRAILYRPSTGQVITMTTDVVIEKADGL